MQRVAVPVIAMLAINFYVGSYYLYIYLKRRQKVVHLPVALLCFSVCLYDILCVGLYTSHSLEQGIVWQRLQLYAVALIGISAVWFVRLYLGLKGRRVVFFLFIWFLLLTLLSLVVPPDLTLTPSRPSIKNIDALGFLRITYYEAEIGLIDMIGVVSSLLIYAYMLVLLIRRYRHTRDWNLLVITLSLFAWFGGAINDAAVASRLYSFFYVSEYAFLIVVLGASSVLLNEFVGLYAAVEESNRSLETRVAERTREQEKLNEELRQLAERYRAIFLDAPIGIFHSTREGKLISVNPAFARMMGYDSPELIIEAVNKRNVAEVLYEDPRRWRGLIDDLARGHSWHRIESHYRRREGGTVVAQVRASSYVPPDGTDPVLEGFVEDITERTRAEQELSRERAFLAALMDNIPDYIYFKDRESRFVLNNRAHARALGAGSPTDMLGKTDFDYFAPAHAQKAFDDEHRIIQTGQPMVNSLEELLWTDRPSTWVSFTKMPLQDEKGEIIGTFGVSRDMTEHRQMEQKSLRMAAMIESSNDAIIGVDLDDSVMSWNKGAEKVFGYTAEEMIGTPITTLLSPDLQDQEPALKEKLGREGRVQQFERLVQRKDGTRISVSTTFSPIQDANGLIIGITSISRDVTDQRALQVQIIRSQRLESLGTLAAGIAHQFNNINAVAQGYLDIMEQDRNLPSSTQSYVKEALKAVHRAVEITERLQGLSGAASTGVESLRLEEVVPPLLSLMEERLQADDISIQVDFQETSPVRVSRSTLSFIVTSLLTNSLHALLDCSSRLITIRTRSAAGFSALEVSDTGCGILPENLSRIFTPFFTTKGEWAEPKSPQSRAKGIGLSLAVCQSSVGESGGWIEVESIPQQGSTFRVWFPAEASIVPAASEDAHFRAMLSREKEGLAASVQTMRTLLDASPLAIIGLDSEGIVRSWNPAATHIFGWTQSEAVGRLPPFVQGEEKKDFRELLARTLAGATIANAEQRRIRRDGSPVDLSISTAPLRDTPGAVVGAIWMVADITAQRLGEATIAEQSRLLDFALDAIIVRGTDERLLYCNEATLKMYGYTRQELQILKTTELLVPEDIPRFLEARRLVTMSGEWEGELRQQTKSGAVINVLSRWSLVRDSAGFPRARLVIHRDISRQKELETQLRRTQRMESLGTLASGIAHDLNNILSPVMMSVEMLRLHSTDPQDHRMLEILETSVHRGSEIVRQMLSFARGSEGELVPLQLRHVTREIETILKETFPKNIAIIVDVPRDLPLVLGEATQIHQVLINLCVNSRDAMPDGGNLTISARAESVAAADAQGRPEARAGVSVVLSVIDDGAGIPEAIQGKIFDPFFTTKEKGHGTGLGLSTVLSIVRGHGGSISCQSSIGKGTWFDITLPALVAGSETRPDEPAPAIPLGSGETVLVIDDDVSILQITQQILESYDYRVLSANGGAAAVELLREGPPGDIQLILTDMDMPAMGGAAAVNALHSLESNIPVIIMSGLPPAKDSPEVASLGVKGIIGKPFKAAELLGLIREVLDQNPAAPPAPSA